MRNDHSIRILINRLARLDSAAGWDGDLNPTQRAALEYLSEANQFSRSPSHVADYLGTTRGTMSQTLKALMRKGYAAEHRQKSDQRSISYELTEAGLAAVTEPNPIADAIGNLPADVQGALKDGLRQSLKLALEANGGQSFGRCKTCAYHDAASENGFCTLLGLQLDPGENNKICIEHKEA
ncbi:winged helix-turn-helix transcriptional regulator [Tropicibacter sp. R16_0]|uniref:MarR family winged helix-turn-helix transcriptional regulator n=1 Tax=Tropicibacter sp. R16_0 TaxID=2821102 RepID=UPI001ADB5916|nr:MarR family winged helix-turn-helix transcriptional regulator [Tropicibacter sp. R16_0]MBO9449862.1 winged helix-turn-helix transcriptional regulator [Tropicibacter sp. R16_0]